MKVYAIAQKYVDDNCGLKAVSLKQLYDLGINVPPFFVVPNDCFLEFCRQNSLMNPLLFFSSDTFHDVLSMLPENLSVEMVTDLPEDKYMIRSSSTTCRKEPPQFSSMISGAFDSYYSHNIDNIEKKILDVWKSLYSFKAYQQCKLVSEEPIVSGMGVVIQKYISPEISGIAHTNERYVDVNWVNGHLSSIVSGKEKGYSVRVYVSKDHDYIVRGLEKSILELKNHSYFQLIKELYDICIKIKDYIETDQEIEWIYDGSKLWFVQTQNLIS